MNLLFKMNWSLRRAAIEDLKRPHTFAFERIGFFHCRAASSRAGLIVLAEAYSPVADDHYVKDTTVGARIGSAAIREALQASLTNGFGIFHAHMHEHMGRPRPSRTDIVESCKLMPDFFNVTPSMPHGTLILSEDSAIGLCWNGQSPSPSPFDRIEFVGAPLRIIEMSV
jgi:hypothetical protein